MSIQSKDTAKLAAEALEPFAKADRIIEEDGFPGGHVVHGAKNGAGERTYALTAGDFRRAREARDLLSAAPAIPTETGQGFLGWLEVHPIGARYAISHDGFVGVVVGHYKRLDGKKGVVLQQDGTSVVHVYGEKWLNQTAASAIDIPAPAGGEEAVEDGSRGSPEHYFEKAACEWAVERWKAEVEQRPLQNVHRRSLDITWRQVIRHFGRDDERLCGPRHDDLVALSPTPASHPAPDHHLRVEVESLRAEQIAWEALRLELSMRATTAETRIAELEAAAKPFADFAEGLIPAFVDDMPLTKGSAFAKRQVTVGDFRSLRSALASSNKPVEASR